MDWQEMWVDRKTQVRKWHILESRLRRKPESEKDDDEDYETPAQTIYTLYTSTISQHHSHTSPTLGVLIGNMGIAKVLPQKLYILHGGKT